MKKLTPEETREIQTIIRSCGKVEDMLRRHDPMDPEVPKEITRLRFICSSTRKRLAELHGLYIVRIKG